MIDIRRLRSSYDEVRANLARRKIDLSNLDKVVALDERVRQLSSQRDDVRSQIKSISKEVGDAHRSGDKAKAEELATQSRSLGEEEKKLDDETTAIDAELRELLLIIPNEISDHVPDGTSEADNPIVRQAPEREWAEHQKVPHWVIGEELGILDSENAVKMSGSMFNMYRGAGAALARALCQYALDINADVWEEIRPPSIVRTETMISTGHLPKDEDNMYSIERDELWAIPTAEVPLTSMERDEILDEAQLPMRMMAYTPCYRREAGSAGKDTRGLLRVHEFDKVELMGYATPETAEDLMIEIRDRAEKLFINIGLQTRIIEICSADLGRGHHRSFDIEAYAPGVGAWLELSSCSWYSDYQSRRANVRYRTSNGIQMTHTCNGSAVAVPRAWATLVETHRQPDGSVLIPEVLQQYMRGLKVIPAK